MTEPRKGPAIPVATVADGDTADRKCPKRRNGMRKSFVKPISKIWLIDSPKASED